MQIRYPRSCNFGLTVCALPPRTSSLFSLFCQCAPGVEGDERRAFVDLVQYGVKRVQREVLRHEVVREAQVGQQRLQFLHSQHGNTRKVKRLHTQELSLTSR